MSFGLHVQLQPDLTALLAQSKPAAMLYFNPGDSIPHKARHTIGRIYVPNQDTLLRDNPVELGLRMADEAIASARKNSIEYWTGPNEPAVGSNDAIARLIACEQARVNRLSAAGLKAVVFNFSVGWPRENTDTHQLDTAPFDAFMKKLPMSHMVGFHEYWTPVGPLNGSNYDPLNPSKIYRFKHWPYEHMIAVTECGIDISGSQYDGWQAHCPIGMSMEAWADVYAGQLKQYYELVSEDNRVQAVVVFTYGPGYGWGMFDILPYWQKFSYIWQNTPSEGGGDNMTVFLAPDARIPDNLRAHHFVNGMVMGSVVRIVAADEAWKRWGHTDTIKTGATYWKVNNCTFLNEEAAGGNVGIYLNYVDENGAPVPGMQMWLAWPSNSLEYDNWIGKFHCGSGGNGETHVYPDGSGTVTMGGGNFTNISDGSTVVGPYCVAAAQDGPSEVAAGFGLPNNHHVSYAVQFKRAKWNQSGGGTPDPDPDPGEPGTTVTDWGKLAAALRAAADVLDS